MEDNPEKQLKRKKTKHCPKTVSSLLDVYESRLQKQMPTETAGDSEHSVEQSPLIDDANKQLMDTVIDMESIQQQAQVVVPQNYNTQTTLVAFVDRSTIHSNANKRQVAKVTINQQDELSDNDNGQIGANINPTVQALFNGTLPDDFYLHLMSVIGIQECLISNRLVCPFWNDLVLERCRNQKSLKLFENFKCLMNYGELLLKFEKMDDTSLIFKSIGDDLIFEGLEIDHKQLVNIWHKEMNDYEVRLENDYEVISENDYEVRSENDYEVRSENEEVECGVQNEVSILDKKRESSKVLTNLFPGVNQLVLCPEYESFINVEHLLQFYAEQLTSLTMTDFGCWMNESPKTQLQAVSFPMLKSLNALNFSLEDDQLFSLLPQLESLTLHSSKISLETFLRTGTQLEELNLFYFESVYTEPVEQFSKRPTINSKLRKFSFDLTENELDALEFISRNMTSLESLKLYFELARYNFRTYRNDNRHLHLVTSYLVPLHQLHSLTLQAPVSFFLLDDNQLADILPLPSVRQLKLLLFSYDSLPLESMDLFSRAIFTAFPNVEHVFISFVGNKTYYKYIEQVFGRCKGDGCVDSATFAAFEDFASKHPNVVQLFRSKNMSKFTNLPNAVSPLLGPHRQVYEEYIEVEELFGVALCQLAASLVTRQGEGRPNLKIALRPADPLTAMSTLLQLLESGAFSFTDDNIFAMIRHMSDCALKYDSSQVALFVVTVKCVLILLDCDVVDFFEPDKVTSFLDTEDLNVYSLFEMIRYLVKHYKIQQFDDKSLLLQLYKGIVKILESFVSVWDYDGFNDFKMFKILLKLANYYKAQQLNVLDNDEELLLHIYSWIDEHLKEFEWDDRLGKVIRKLIRSENGVYQDEMECALLRCCESTDDNYHYYFQLLNGEIDSDSSDGSSSA